MNNLMTSSGDALELLTRVGRLVRAARARFFHVALRARAAIPLLLTGLLAACGSTDDGIATSTTTPFATAHATATAPSNAVQYVRLQALSEVNGNAFASMAEFNLVDGSGATMSRAGWSVVADSQEVVGENAPATNAIDGDPNSFWHTQWQGALPPMPHTFTVNLASPRIVAGFKYLPRQIGTNGRIANYKFYTSTDGVNWTLAVQGTFPGGTAETTVMLNAAPVLPAIADRIDPIGNAVALTVAATDANNDTLSYSASELPPGMAINAATGSIGGTPTVAGTYAVALQVSDGIATTSGSFKWTVAASASPGITARWVRLQALSEVNGNPWASAAEFNVLDAGNAPIPRTGWVATADSQETVGENAPATNAIDGDPNSFWHTQWQGGSPALPHALTVDLGAVRSIGGFKYLPRQVGVNGRIANYRFFTSTDGVNWTLATSGTFANTTAESTVMLSAPTNHAPTITAPANRSDFTGQAVTQALTASDADGDALAYSATGLPTGLSINAATGVIGGTPTAAGTFNVAAQVSDGKATASAAFVWTVTAAPVAAATNARFVRLDALSEINGNPWASMAEFNVVGANGAPLSRTGWTVVADSQETLGENAPATNAIDGDPNSYWHTQWSGVSPPPPHSFLVDMGGTFAVTGFRYLPRQVGVNGRIASYRFSTSLDGVSWQVVNQGSFSATSVAEQSGSVGAGITNHPPTLASLPTPRTDTVGVAVTLALSANDADGDALAYAATGLPSGMAINAATGAVSGTPSIAGTSHVQVTVADGHGGSAVRSFDWVVSAPPNVATPGGASGSNPPVVFNVTSSAAAGDIVSLQGDNFGATPVAYLESNPTVALEIVNRFGTGWLAVQIPSNATGALALRVSNATGTSARIRLNAARPDHLDALQLNPGGAFRIFGRNLLVSGGTPTVTVNGVTATVDVPNSDENMLRATVPATLPASASATIAVDNGNGSGATVLDRPASILPSGTGDPFALGVGWAATFGALNTNTIYPASDSRISNKALCNGSHDDSAGIQQAIDLAATAGGGVVQLGTGRCVASSILSLRSNVVVRGAGKSSTEVYHTAASYPFAAQAIDRAGLSDMTITNAVDNGDGTLLKGSTRVFIKNVRMNLGTSRQMYLDGNTNFVIANSDIVQTGNANLQGPYLLIGSAGLVFENNTTTWVTGAPTFGRIHDGVVRGNHFTRNATNPNNPSVVHSLTLDFAYRVAIVANTFDVLGGPITDKGRNDGETILSEGGGAARTEMTGTVSSATSLTMTDAATTINVDPFGTATIPENYGIAIVSGKGMGQMRHVVAYSSGTRTLSVDRAWDVVPDGSSHYVTYVFGLETTLIKANVLSQQSRGIWLYNSAIRDVVVVGNTISEGGGIYLRSYQNLATKTFTPIFNVLIKDNHVTDTTHQWPAYINVVGVNGDGSAFGTGTIGIEIRNNFVTANTPNLYMNTEEYAGTEGMTARMPLESGGYYETTGNPRVLGTIFTGNTCTNCDVGVRIGTGSVGTTIVNVHLVATPQGYTDTSSVPTGAKSVATVVR